MYNLYEDEDIQSPKPVEKQIFGVCCVCRP